MSARPSIRVAFIGSGAVNFGGAEGPWNHSARVEQLQASRTFDCTVVGIADPLVGKAHEVLAQRKAEAAQHDASHSDHAPVAPIYDECRVFGDYNEMLAKTHPTVVFIGVPPVAHGGFGDNRKEAEVENAEKFGIPFGPACEMELNCIKAGASVFVEKPVSMRPVEEARRYAAAVQQLADEKGLVVSVGYMFRYAAAVRRAQEILREHGRPVAAILARYNSAYAAINHPFWWDARRSGGPVVEQGTHFADLCRLFGGEVVETTVEGMALPATSITGAGDLSNVPSNVDESAVDPAHRLPRVHSATMRFAGGAVGSFTHALLLHGEKYESSIDVWADGLRISLRELYSDSPYLRVRGPASDEDQRISFKDDDPYLTEVDVFFRAVSGDASASVASTFADATETYALTRRVQERCGASGARSEAAIRRETEPVVQVGVIVPLLAAGILGGFLVHLGRAYSK